MGSCGLSILYIERNHGLDYPISIRGKEEKEKIVYGVKEEGKETQRRKLAKVRFEEGGKVSWDGEGSFGEGIRGLLTFH